MFLPLLIFSIFTLLATSGAFWIGKAQHSLKAGVIAGLSTLLFLGSVLATLYFWVWPMLETIPGSH